MKIVKPLITLLLSMLCLVTFTSCHNDDHDAQLVTVNDVKVAKSVYQLFLNDQKAATVNEFGAKYGAEYDKNFWAESHDGKTALNYAQEKAIAKLRLFLAEDQYLVNAKLLDRPLDEFVNNAASISAGANLNGLAAAQKKHNELILKLEDQYVQQQSAAADDEKLNNYYEAHKDTDWKKPALVSYQTLTFKRAEISDVAAFTALVSDVLAQRADAALAEVAATFQDQGFIGTMGSADSAHDEDKYYRSYLRDVDDAQAGNPGHIFANWASEEEMVLVRVDKVEEAGLYSFAESHLNIEKRYFKDELHQNIGHDADAANVQYDSKQLDAVKPD